MQKRIGIGEVTQTGNYEMQWMTKILLYLYFG